MAEKWTRHKFGVKLVNPSNKRKYKVLVVGTGLAGASAAATLAELGYQVESFTYSDTRVGAFNCSARRHQCGKKLSQRWGLCASPFLRYG